VGIFNKRPEIKIDCSPGTLERFDHQVRQNFSVTIDINIESNSHLSLTADSEIKWNFSGWFTCKEICINWLVIQKIWLGGLTAKI
jgi:hypothetical protein